MFWRRHGCVIWCNIVLTDIVVCSHSCATCNTEWERIEDTFVSYDCSNVKEECKQSNSEACTSSSRDGQEHGTCLVAKATSAPAPSSSGPFLRVPTATATAAAISATAVALLL